jgi:hypothetical protein
VGFEPIILVGSVVLALKILIELGPSGTLMIVSRAFVSLNCNIGTKTAIIEEMQDIICVSQTIALQR